MAFLREGDREAALVLINRGTEAQDVVLSRSEVPVDNADILLDTAYENEDGAALVVTEQTVSVSLPPLSGAVVGNVDLTE